jgi:hypothetical protein
VWDEVSPWARSNFLTASDTCRLQTISGKVIDAGRILRQQLGEQAEHILHMEVPLEESVSKFASDNPDLDAHELVAEYLAENAEFKAT